MRAGVALGSTPLRRCGDQVADCTPAVPSLVFRRAAPPSTRNPPRPCFSHGVQRHSEARRLIRSHPIAQPARGGLVFWQFWQWVPGACVIFRGVARGGERVGSGWCWHPCPSVDLPRPPLRLRVVSPAAAQTCPGFRLADIADRGLGRLNWAESAPTALASGMTGVGAIAAAP